MLRYFAALLVTWGLRDYGIDGQIGLESTPEKYVEKLVMIFREVKRVLRDDGTVWLNIADSYSGGGRGFGYGGKQDTNKGCEDMPKSIVPNGLKSKDRIGIPHMVVFALRTDGWWWRDEVVWSKLNPMPESVTDRTTKSHEFVFLLSKSASYYYDADAIREPHTWIEKRERPSGMERQAQKYREKVNYGGGGTGFAGHSGGYKADGTSLNHPLGRNCRSVWTIATEPTPYCHFATFPQKFVERPILAGSKPGDVVLDPFAGSGTVGLVAKRHGRSYVLIDLSEEYCKIAEDRLRQRELF